MNHYKMVFTPKKEIETDREAVYDKIDWLFNAMQKNGQILGGYDVAVKGKKYIASFSAYDKAGLDEKYHNEYVTKYYNELAEMFDIRLTGNGEILETGNVCRCKSPSWRYLMYRGMCESSVKCGDCNNSVPFYKLPKEKGEEEYQDLNHWEYGYGGVNTLWFYGKYDAFSYNQMNNPNSKLSNQGRNICRRLEKSTGIPFYYFLFYSDREFVESCCGVKVKQPYNICPVCEERWNREDNTDILKCHKCRIMTYETDLQ